MNILGFEISRKARVLSLDQLIAKLDAVAKSMSGITVTPENCMQAPTVNAVVTAVTRRMSILPCKVLQKGVGSNGRPTTEPLPNHPVQRLLNTPNQWLTRVNYWQDATSWLMRYGNYYAFKQRGSTGPIRGLVPLPSGNVDVTQDDELALRYRVQLSSGEMDERSQEQIHHVRGPAKNGYVGDSPVTEARESIALEMAAERFGGSFFGNGGTPGLVLSYAAAQKGFNSDESRRQFMSDFAEKYSGSKRFSMMLLPQGMNVDQTIAVENDKAQFLETRQYQRTVIAGAFGVPPHLVGDLSKGTFNNVEQQNLSFTLNVVQPYAQMFEAAMERDFLTPADRARGVIIRFNLAGTLRGDFKSQQEALKIVREAGVINPNEWREHLNLNPISEADGGETYWQEGPSGQGQNAGDDDSDDDGGDDDEADKDI